MKRLTLLAIALFAIATFPGCTTKSTAKVNSPIGATTQVVTSEGTIELNYDLKATIDNAESVEWHCECQVDDDG